MGDANFWGTIFTSVAASGVLIFLLRTWISERLKQSIQHEYASKLEQFKSELACSNSIELERLKSQLTISANQRQIRFVRAYENMAKALTDVYAKLQLLHSTTADYVSMSKLENGPSLEDKANSVQAAIDGFFSCFKPNRIYLPKRIVSKIDQFYDHHFAAAYAFRCTIHIKVNEGGSRIPLQWEKLHSDVNQRGSEILEEIEDEFRRLIGMEAKSSGIPTTAIPVNG